MMWTQPRKLEDFGTLRPAEETLFAERNTGGIVVLGDGARPGRDAPAERRVRASFIRWLATAEKGDSQRPHEKGLKLRGAFIESDGPEGAETRGIDLEGCVVGSSLALINCLFEDPPLLRDARLAMLLLNGSATPGLIADRLVATGSLLLRAGFESDGEVRLLGARIDGNLECDGAVLRNPGGIALYADGLTTDGSVFLRNDFRSDGVVRLSAARIDGNFECDRARLQGAGGVALQLNGARVGGNVFLRHGFSCEGSADLLGVRVGGGLSCETGAFINPGAVALSLDSAHVEGAFMLRSRSRIDGTVLLAAATIGALADEPGCWPQKPGEIVLDRCIYGAFMGTGIDARSRIPWLDRQDAKRLGKEFWPQPWEHCAKVLREMGHAEDARKVLIAKERRQRAARRQRAPFWLRGPLWVRDRLLGITVRYGRAPMLAFVWLIGLWVLGAAVFAAAERAGALRPVAQVGAAHWTGCAVEAGAARLACFAATEAGAAYPQFDPVVYSLDLTVPVVQFGIARWWGPDGTADWRFAGAARVWMWVQIGLGWALSLLAVAGFSGLVKSD